eukprot:719107-Pleurochrysis_carterae.AAC.3
MYLRLREGRKRRESSALFAILIFNLLTRPRRPTQRVCFFGCCGHRFGLSAGGARAIAGKTWRNCTEARLAPGHADWTEPNGGDGGDGTPAAAVDDLCVGPLAFAKGPLLLISGDAVRAAVYATARRACASIRRVTRVHQDLRARRSPL